MEFRADPTGAGPWQASAQQGSALPSYAFSLRRKPISSTTATPIVSHQMTLSTHRARTTATTTAPTTRRMRMSFSSISAMVPRGNPIPCASVQQLWEKDPTRAA